MVFRHNGAESLKLARQRKTAVQAIATRTIQNSQIFFTASSVCSPPAMEFPGPGVVAVAASAVRRHEEPASDASQLSSLRKPS
jgi:hypothetical protein